LKEYFPVEESALQSLQPVLYSYYAAPIVLRCFIKCGVFSFRVFLWLIFLIDNVMVFYAPMSFNARNWDSFSKIHAVSTPG
jgi:hypothetical protein